MAEEGQRTWRRVDAPGTHRGHALEATIGGNRWSGWENPDGTWSLRLNDSAPVVKRNWTEVRQAAERQPNPMSPVLAAAAAAGMAMAMRDHLIRNPGAPLPTGPMTCDDAIAVLGVLGQVGVGGTGYVARPPRCDRYGNLWVMVRPGYACAARREIRRLRLGVPVRIMEAVT